MAHNTATASANKIHDDGVARRYGFSGGLVPGVDLYAYMTQAPAEAWGDDWLRHGSMRARFIEPVFEGERVQVVSGTVTASTTTRLMSLELRDEAGMVRATGEAGLPGKPPPAPPTTAWPWVEPASHPPRASPRALAAGTALGLAARRFDADRAAEYLADIDERLPLYTSSRVAHPGWLLRHANRLLSTNVRLGPWIHVESATQHFELVNDRDSLGARATVVREWDRKGHRFVELDVGLIVDRDRVVARISHTAIYRPRPPG